MNEENFSPNDWIISQTASKNMYRALQLFLTHVKTWPTSDPAVVKVCKDAFEQAKPTINGL